MVGKDLQGTEQRGDNQSPRIFPPIGKDDTSYHRRQIGKCHDLPNMSCSNDDKEIAAERPDDSPQSG